jgi:hypothetical protein
VTLNVGLGAGEAFNSVALSDEILLAKVQLVLYHLPDPQPDHHAVVGLL